MADGGRPGRLRLLALDLDGTVLTPDLRVDERDVAALRALEAAGVTIVACTGRPFPGAVPWVQRLGLAGPIVCYQGAQVRDLDGGTLLDQGVPREAAIEVIRFARARDLHVQAYRDDRLIIERDRPEAHEYAHHAGMDIHLVDDLEMAMAETTPKLVIVTAAAGAERLLPEARALWAGRLEVATSMPTYIEFTRAGADKRRALEFLSARMGVTEDQTAAVGDGRNDESMLRWAATAFAIDGSPPEVVAAAAGRTVGRPGTGGIEAMVGRLIG